MLALPLLLIVEFCTLAASLSGSIARGLRRLFEILSGRKLRTRSSTYFGYSSRPDRRRSRI